MREYIVIFEPGVASWSAYVPDVPDVPGCIAAAETRTETERLIRETLVLHLRAMAADGEPIPEPSGQAQVIAVAV